MNSVFEHEINEVGGRLDEFIELLEVLELAALLFVENVEVVLRGIKLHVFNLCRKIKFLIGNLLITLFQLLFLLLERADLLIDLFLHHLIKVLLLNLKLLHYAAERLLKPVDFVIELLAHLKLKL